MSKTKSALMSKGRTAENERKWKKKSPSPTLSVLPTRLHPHICFRHFYFRYFYLLTFLLSVLLGLTQNVFQLSLINKNITNGRGNQVDQNFSCLKQTPFSPSPIFCTTLKVTLKIIKVLFLNMLSFILFDVS